jgi:hypothetical protein
MGVRQAYGETVELYNRTVANVVWIVMLVILVCAILGVHSAWVFIAGLIG